MANPKLFGAAPDQEYARALRAIGNDLASYSPENLEIELLGPNYKVTYHVQGEATRTRALLVPQSHIYDTESLAAIDAVQITKRGTANQNADIYDLGETLRTAGRLIDRIEGKLLRLTKNTHSLLLQYHDSKGNLRTDEFSNQDLFRIQREFLAGRDAAPQVLDRRPLPLK